MRTHTQSFKDEIKEFGREFDDNLYYTNNGTTTTYGQEHINSVNYYYDTSLLKSVMQTLEIDTDLNLQLNNKIDYGCSLLNDEVRFNNFNIIKKEDQKDTKSYRYTCYDNMVKMMIDYVSIREYTSTTDVTFDDDKTYYQWDNQEQTYVIYTGSTTGNPYSLGLYEDTTYPTNVRTLLQRLCDYVGITFANASDTFTNYDKVIDSEHYSTYNSTKYIWENIGYTCRDILDDLAEATGSFIVINNNGELELKYPTTTNDTVDENYFSENNVSIGKHYGPINVVVLSRAGVDDLYYPQTLPQNPCEIKINNNPILEQTNREDFIQGIYNAINGLEFYLNDFNSTGIMYYEVGDLYNVSIDSTTYPCLMLNDNIKRNDGLSEIIHTDEPQTSVSDFKYASPTDRLELTARNAYIRADKAEGKVEAVVSAIGDDNGDVTSASLILAINENNDPTIKLEAKQVYINGVTFDSNNNMTINQGTINIEQGPGDRSLYTYYDDSLMNEFDEAELLPLGLYIKRTDNTTQQVTDYANYGVYEIYIQDSAGNKLNFLPSRLSLYDSNSIETFSVDTMTGNTTINGNTIVGSVKSKNLFNYDAYNNNFAYLIKDSSINGFKVRADQYICSSNIKLREFCPELEEGKTYFLSGTSSSSNAKYIYVGEIWNFGTSKTITSTMLDTDVYFYGIYPSGTGSSSNYVTISNIQIEEGTSATTFKNCKGYGYVSGRNANGNYIKYDDGTLIQWNSFEDNTIAFSNNYGSRGIIYLASKYITFPVAFVGNLPSVTCGQFKWGTGGSWGGVSEIALTYTTLFGYDLFQRASGTKCLISWYAIGKWK